MRLRADPGCAFVFDLDDTLYAEIDFVRSGFASLVADLPSSRRSRAVEAMTDRFRAGGDAIGSLVAEHRDDLADPSTSVLLARYRRHHPEIALHPDARRLVGDARSAGVRVGVVTDGRSLTQRNKLRALGLDTLVDSVVISDEFGSKKPDRRNFEHFAELWPDAEITMFGDNTGKDFAVPAELGWTTICRLDAGENIHRQDLDRLPPTTHHVVTFDEIDLAVG